MLTFTTLARLLPAASRIVPRLVSSSLVSEVMSPSSNSWVAGLMGACPATKTNPPATTAWEYGPRTLGKLGEVITFRSTDAERFCAGSPGMDAIDSVNSRWEFDVFEFMLMGSFSLSSSPGLSRRRLGDQMTWTHCKFSAATDAKVGL